MTVSWLIGVARHKLVDHWRWQGRQERLLRAVEGSSADVEDPWEAQLDVLRAREVLGRLAPQHRAVLTLRYLDGLSVPAAAEVLGRSVGATEALLVRARQGFRRIYEEEGGRDVSPSTPCAPRWCLWPPTLISPPGCAAVWFKPSHPPLPRRNAS